MVIIAYQARSPQLAAAARLIAISWIFSLQIWIVLDPPLRSFAFAGVDLVLAVAFYQMSRGRWFPAPLFFLHAALVIYHLYTVLTAASMFWIALFFNRTLEIAALYVIACAGYRIYLLRVKALAGR